MEPSVDTSDSYSLAISFLGEEVSLVIDRPLGSSHPKHGFMYEVNYGYVPDTIAPDGEELDAYYLGTNTPLTNVTGICIAVIHRVNDDDDKLVVAPKGMEFSDAEIQAHVYFQEQWFESVIVR